MHGSCKTFAEVPSAYAYPHYAARTCQSSPVRRPLFCCWLEQILEESKCNWEPVKSQIGTLASTQTWIHGQKYDMMQSPQSSKHPSKPWVHSLTCGWAMFIPKTKEHKSGVCVRACVCEWAKKGNETWPTKACSGLQLQIPGKEWFGFLLAVGRNKFSFAEMTTLSSVKCLQERRRGKVHPKWKEKALETKWRFLSLLNPSSVCSSHQPPIFVKSSKFWQPPEQN